MEIKILTNLCRICLSDDVLLSIFESTSNEKICDKIMACAAVQVAFGDPLPSQICKQCYRALEISYLFKTKCEQMDRQLRKIIKDQMNIMNTNSVKCSSVQIAIEPSSSTSPVFKDIDNFNFSLKRAEVKSPAFENSMSEKSDNLNRSPQSNKNVNIPDMREADEFIFHNNSLQSLNIETISKNILSSSNEVNPVYTFSTLTKNLNTVAANLTEVNSIDHDTTKNNHLNKNESRINTENTQDSTFSFRTESPEIETVLNTSNLIDQTIQPANGEDIYFNNDELHLGEECEVITDGIVSNDAAINVNNIMNNINTSVEQTKQIKTFEIIKSHKTPKGKFVVIKSVIKPENIHYVNMNVLNKKLDINKLTLSAAHMESDGKNEISHIKSEIPEPASFIETETMEANFEDSYQEHFPITDDRLAYNLCPENVSNNLITDTDKLSMLTRNLPVITEPMNTLPITTMKIKNNLEVAVNNKEVINNNLPVITERIDGLPFAKNTNLSFVSDVNLIQSKKEIMKTKKRSAREIRYKGRGRPRKTDKYKPPQGVSYLKSGRKNTPVYVRPRSTKRSQRYRTDSDVKMETVHTVHGTKILVKSMPVVKRARVEKIIPSKRYDDKKPEFNRKLSTNLLLSDKHFNKLNDPQKQVLFQRLKLQSFRPTSKKEISERGMPTPIHVVPPKLSEDDISDDDQKEISEKIKRKRTRKNTISDDLAIIQSSSKNKIKYKQNLQTIDQDLKLINGSSYYRNIDSSNKNKKDLNSVKLDSKELKCEKDLSESSLKVQEESSSPAKTGRHTAIKSKRPRKRNHISESSDPQKIEIELKMVPRKSERQRSPKKIFPEIDIFASPKRKVIEIPVAEPTSLKYEKPDYEIEKNERNHTKFKIKIRGRHHSTSEDESDSNNEENELKTEENSIVGDYYNEVEVETENDDSQYYNNSEIQLSIKNESTDEHFKLESFQNSNSEAVKKILERESVKLDYGAGLSCDVCNKSFPYRSHLIRHVRTHTGLKPYTCDRCKKCFTSLSSLNIHVRNHMGDHPYSCEVCGRGFVLPSVLKRHMLSHTGEHPFQCEICYKTFVHESSLKTHLKMHTIKEPQHKCDICEKRFKYLSTLTSHLKTHSGIKPYTCAECRKAFYRRSLLTRHMRSHTKERPYKCKLCKARFAYSGGLASHKKLHTGIRPYECELCDFQFFRSSHLKNHMEKIHNDGILLQCQQCNINFDSKPLYKRHLSSHTNDEMTVGYCTES